MNRDPHIIFISTSLSHKLAEWLSPADLEQIKMITDFTALCSTKKTEPQKPISWCEDMEFLAAEEEKSLQPTNPYFGKEQWKRKRKR